MKNIRILYKRFVECFDVKYANQTTDSAIEEIAQMETCPVKYDMVRQWYYYSKDTGISAKHVDFLASLFDVDPEYLLGLQDEPRRAETDTAKYIGLSESNVSYLRNLTDKQRAVLNRLFSDDSGFAELVDALWKAAIAQQEVDELERLNDGIERHINDNLEMEAPEPEEDIRLGWTDTALRELRRLETMLAGNVNGIEAVTCGKDLVIRKFYNVLEKFVPDITVKKWTMDHFQAVATRIHSRTDEMMDRQFQALQKMNTQ